MIQFAYIIVFIISIAATLFGVLLTYQMRKESRNKVYTSVFYQQILYYAFAFYGIWGSVFSKLILSSEISNVAAIEKWSTLILILAIPFLLASLWFLLLVSFDVTRKVNYLKWSIIALIFSILVSFGIFQFFDQNTLSANVLMILSIAGLLVNIIVAYLWLNAKVFDARFRVRITVSVYIFISGGLISTGALFNSHSNWLTLGFILGVFVFNTWQPIVLRYFLKLKEENNEKSLSISNFIEKYGITPREQEIIEQVCSGKSNQQIASQLFITLQTVKDHTSRIYLKTDVKNRTQLANLVRSFQNSNAE